MHRAEKRFIAVMVAIWATGAVLLSGSPATAAALDISAPDTSTPDAGAIAARRAANIFISTSSNNFPPVNITRNLGQLDGFGQDLARAVINAVDGRVEFRPDAVWTRVMENLTSGRADFIHDMGYTPERSLAFDFTDPILTMPEMIFVDRERFDIIDIGSLDGKRVSCVDKHISHLYLRQFPGITCQLVKTPVDGLKALVEGKVEAFVYPREIALFLAQKHGWVESIKTTGDPLRHLNWHMAVRKGDVEMLSLLNRGLSILRREGTLTHLQDKWFGQVVGGGYSVGQVGLIVLAVVLPLSLVFGVGYVVRLRASRRKLREQVRETKAAEETLDQFFNLSTNMQCIAGFDGYFKRLNPAWSETLGFSDAELTAVPFIDFVHEEDRESTGREAAKLAEGGTTVLFENRYQTKDGGWRWLLWHAAGFPKRDLIYANATDITELKDQEDKIRRSRDLLERMVEDRTRELAATNARLQTLVTTSPAVIYCCSPEGDFGATYISPNVTERMGFSPEQFTGFPPFWAENIHPDDAPTVFENMSQLFANDRHSHTYRFRFGDGSYHWMHDDLVLRRDEAGRPVEIIGAWIDITERRESEEAAKQANLEKSRFLASMSHELRTPLNAILGFGQLLRSDPRTTLTEDQDRHVGHILEGGQHLMRLIDEVLDLAKIEAGGVSLSVETLRLADVVPACVDMIGTNAKGARITVEDRLDYDVLPPVYADHTRMRQVLLNLLGNAVKYNSPGGRVSVSGSMTADGFVRLSITDTGFGIAEEDKAGVFKAFNRLGMDTRGIEGSGIGLVLSKQIMQLMGGRIGFTSTLGEGSTFWVEFPPSRELVKTDEPVFPQAQTSARLFENTPRRVLYVEDNPANIKVMETLFQRIDNVDLKVATSGEDALQLIDAETPHLILIDINLPGMSGVDLMRTLRDRATTREVPAIAVSANAIPTDIEAVMGEGFNDYITKPFDITRLINTVLSTLAPEPVEDPVG